MHSIVIESACMHDGEDVLLCVFINCPESRLVCFGGCALFLTPVLEATIVADCCVTQPQLFVVH